MPEVARFTSNSYHVSGPPHTLDRDIPQHIEICGRIPYAVVWDYFNKLRTSRTTELIIVRFHIAHESDKPAYAALFQYFHSRKRIGVIGNNRPHVKDMYLLPLAAQDTVPAQIQPFNGPGLERNRPHTFLGLIVRHKDKQRSASVGHMPVSERSALPGGITHPPPVKRHFSQPEPSGGGTPLLPDWTEPGFVKPKRTKQEPPAIPETTPMDDPIVAQYAHADPTELAEEPYSPTREEREAPYDPSDVMDDIGERRLKDAGTSKDEEGGTPPLPPPDQEDPSKLNNLLENMGELDANDIAHAASDVTENLLTAFSSKPNLTEQQQLLIKLTKQVEDAKKALLDRQIASLQSEIDKAATEITIQSGQAGPVEETTTPMVTATMLQQLPGTKLPSPHILRAPADSSTNTADQSAINLPGSPGTPTEEDQRSGLDMIQAEYVDPDLDPQKATTYTYGNVLTEGGASYPSHPPMPGGHGDGGDWTGAPPRNDKRHAPFDNNNQSQPPGGLPPGVPPVWNQPPLGGPQGPPPQQQWNNPEFQPPPGAHMNPEGPPFRGHHRDRDDRRDLNRPPGGERFPPQERPDRPHRRHSKEGKNRGWEQDREREPPPAPPAQVPPQWDPQQLEEGELPPHEERPPPPHRPGPPPEQEQWRPHGPPPGQGGHRGPQGGHRGPPQGGQRGPPDAGHRGGYGGGQRRDDHRGHNRGHGHRGQGPPDHEDRRGWGGNMHDRGRGKWRGQGGGRGRDHGGNTRYDYHRY